MQVDSRDAFTNLLIRYQAPHAHSVLDLGCATGSLAFALDPRITRYHGADISEVAISEANKAISTCHRGTAKVDFTLSDLRAFRTDERFDVIVFNEVLYYLNLDWIEPEVERYSKLLTPDGIIIVSLKDDSLSKMILKLVGRRNQWIYGAIFQLQEKGPSFKVTYDPMQPAFLQSVFRPTHDFGSLRGA